MRVANFNPMDENNQNENKNDNSDFSALGFYLLMTVFSVTLKLLGFINLEWWLVLIPIYIIPSLTISGYLLLIMGHCIHFIRDFLTNNN